VVIKGLDTLQIIEAIRRGEFDGERTDWLMKAFRQRLRHPAVATQDEGMSVVRKLR
jgi:hypothetical protein